MTPANRIGASQALICLNRFRHAPSRADESAYALALAADDAPPREWNDR